MAIDPADTPGRGSTIVSPAAVASEAEAAPAPPASTPEAAEAAPADDPAPAEGADALAKPLSPRRSGKRGGK